MMPVASFAGDDPSAKDFESRIPRADRLLLPMPSAASAGDHAEELLLLLFGQPSREILCTRLCGLQALLEIRNLGIHRLRLCGARAPLLGRLFGAPGRHLR
jgi:hypothetical protein